MLSSSDKVYQIVNWKNYYENNRSRPIKNCKFVCVPNKQEGDGFLRIISEPEGTAIYGIWCLLLGSASHHEEREGWLTSDGKASGTPWTTSYLALRYRTNEELVSKALKILSSKSVGWIKAHEQSTAVRESRNEVQDSGGVVQEECITVQENRTTVRRIEGELELELEQKNVPRSCPTSATSTTEDLIEQLDDRTRRILDAMLTERIIYIRKTDPPRFRPMKYPPEKLIDDARMLSEKCKTIDPADVIKRVHTWSAGNLRKASTTDRGGLARIKRWCAMEQDGADIGEPANQNKAASIKGAWRSAAGLCCNLMLQESLFDERAVSESIDSTRVRALREKLGDNIHAVVSKFQNDRSMELFLIRQADAMAEAEIANGR